MKKYFLIFLLIGLVGCNKSVDKAEFCKYAKVQPQYMFIYSGEEIKECELLSSESKEGEVLGQKLTEHRANVKLKIEQIEDDCNSAKGLNCNLLDRDCLMDNGKKANFCKYPDAKIVKPKGTIRETSRSLILVSGKDPSILQVFSNTELK